MAAALVLGIFSGSAAWWLVLAAGVSAFRDRLGTRALRRLATGSNALIGLLGLAVIAASLAA